MFIFKSNYGISIGVPKLGMGFTYYFHRIVASKKSFIRHHETDRTKYVSIGRFEVMFIKKKGKPSAG